MKAADWRRLPEVGSVVGIRVVAFVAELLGRTVASWVLFVVATYYALASSRARSASRAFLARVGEPAGFWHVVRHLHTFARVGLDRLFFLRGRLAPFVVTRDGDHHLAAVKGKGAILLGSHLGSFEAMRSGSYGDGLALSIVVDARSAPRVARILRELAPGSDIGVIPVDDDAVATGLRIRDAVRRGEHVGILADRRSPDPARNVVVDFLGGKAAFPAGPFLVAHMLGCPVFQVFGVFRAPNRYELSCEPFADPLKLSREDRDASLRAYVQTYADRLAHHARRAPYAWFNFYDFWSA